MIMIVIMALVISSPSLADNFTDTISIYKKSGVVEPLFKGAYGYAVFPTIGTAGFGIGGPYLFMPEEGLLLGVDVARGPDDTYMYITVGNAR